MVRQSVDWLELLRKQAAGGDLDFLREAVAVLAAAVMEAEVAAQAGAAYGGRSPERHHATQRLPDAAREHARRHRRAADPEAAPGQLLPRPARAPAARRAPCSRSCSRPTRRASRRGASTTSCARSAARASPGAGCRGSARSSTASSRASSTARSTAGPPATCGSKRSPGACARRAALEAGLVEQPARTPSMRDGLSARPTWRPPSSVPASGVTEVDVEDHRAILHTGVSHVKEDYGGQGKRELVGVAAQAGGRG